MCVWSLHWEDPFRGEDPIPVFQYSCLRIPWTEEPGRLQSIGSQKVRHDWSDLAQGISAANPNKSHLSWSSIQWFVPIVSWIIEPKNLNKTINIYWTNKEKKEEKNGHIQTSVWVLFQAGLAFFAVKNFSGKCRKEINISLWSLCLAPRMLFSRSVVSDSLRSHYSSTPGFSVSVLLPEFAQTCVLCISDVDL